MNKRIIVTLGASALLAGTAIAGIASASDRNAAADAKIAAACARKVGKALTRHDTVTAIAAAEGAVALSPQQADYRVLLGQSYLAAGRFVSARGAFADALSLAPANGKAALNLVLAQIATGDWAAARRSLDEHGATIAPADRGLALALAGDPNGAVQLLTQVARSPETSPKVRQNLALSLALSGQWPAARAIAAVDVPPVDLDARLQQWAAFARPRGAADQVASLLGVTPVADPGQPARLALADQPGVAVAAVSAPVAPVPAGVAIAAAGPRPDAPAGAQPGFVAATRVTFGPRAEVVQPLPGSVPTGLAATRVIRLDATPAKMALATAPSARGSWFVQIGAFGSAAVAHDAWNRAARRMPTLAARGPSSASFAAGGTTFHRLSVGGFTRSQADAMCLRYRAIGGSCFVRAGAGDQVASWARKGGVQVASR